MPAKRANILNIFKGADKQWYWRCKAANGQIIAQSEAYTRRASAVRGAKRAYPDTIIIPA